MAMPQPLLNFLRYAEFEPTNVVERLNAELRRRERVIRIFPNRQSVIRLFGTLLMEMDEKWSVGKKYIEMTAYHEWRKEKAKTAEKPTLNE